MYLRITRNDILRSKMISLAIMAFIAAAAMLVALAAILIVNLSGAIDALMTRAKTPHFMQMHSGELHAARVEAFVQHNDAIADHQVLEFLNVDGAQISFSESSLADSVQDNGFSVQSRRFDYLLDLDGRIIWPSDGEVYVPVCYMQDGTTKVGDRLAVFGKEFMVAGFLRDSQMNSLLASSKRFLVSDNDYLDLEAEGSVEYLVEFRLKDPSALRAFEAAYIAAGLDANGPTITYPLFKMMNAISDGLMIAVILLVSVLVVAIAFLCIRFTLLAKIEDDYREIGVLKAIGLRVSDIKRIYLVEYASIALLGALLGYALSFLFRGMLLENIRIYMGESENASLAALFGGFGVLLVFATIVVYVNGVLKRFRKVSPAQAIRFGMSHERTAGAGWLRLSRNGMLSTNALLGVMDVFARKRLYVTMLAVLMLAVFITIVPQNLHNTISSEEFISYMGIGDCDVRIDVQQTDGIVSKAAEISAAMEEDASIAKHVVLTTRSYSTMMPDGTEDRIKVELGDHSVFPVRYAEGSAPTTRDDIALSEMNAKELSKGVGDLINLTSNGQERPLVVCGIYPDITNGGKTAKAGFVDTTADTMWSVISAEFSDDRQIDVKTAEYAQRFAYAKVSDIDEYVSQTFGATQHSVAMASWAAVVISLMIGALITLLFMRMLVSKDRYSIALAKALGFTNWDIAAQYTARSVLIVILGLVVGTVLANTLGEMLVGIVMSSFGASSFEFDVNPLLAYVASPLMMALVVLGATFVSTRNAGNIRISDYIKD